MRKAIIGIGVPGAGKTTVLKSFAERNGYAYVSTDDVRVELTGDVGNRTRNREVFGLTVQRASDFIKEGKTIVFDTIFTNPKYRRDFIAWLHKQGIEHVQGLYVSTPIEITRERNSNREKVVPSEILEEAHKSIMEFPPNTADGLDALFVLNENQELIRAEITKEKRILRKEMRMSNK